MALVVRLVPLVAVGALIAGLVYADIDELVDSVVGGLEDVQDWTTGPPAQPRLLQVPFVAPATFGPGP